MVLVGNGSDHHMHGSGADYKHQTGLVTAAPRECECRKVLWCNPTSAVHAGLYVGSQEVCRSSKPERTW